MLDREKVKSRLERFLRGGAPMLGVNAEGLRGYIVANASPDNPMLNRFESEREAKWKAWDADVRTGRKIPASNDCIELSWELVARLGELKGDAWKLPYSMYLKSMVLSVELFLHDWGSYFTEAVDAIVEADVPEVGGAREKQQKFQILDSPTLFDIDLARPGGVFGKAAIYFDLDNFKAINSKLTEVVVDQLVLPNVMQEIRRCAEGLGFAYAEGGDEFLMLLPNATLVIAVAIAESIREAIERIQLEGAAAAIQLKASFGVAHARGEEVSALRQRANEAKKYAKEHGKNCVAEWHVEGCRKATGMQGAAQSEAFTKPLQYPNLGIV